MFTSTGTFIDHTDRAAGGTSATERHTVAPVLITEQEVLFATAAALTAPPKRRRPRRKHYPSRRDIFEDSRMAREMDRL